MAFVIKMEDEKILAETIILLGYLNGSYVCCKATVENATPRVDIHNCREGERINVFQRTRRILNVSKGVYESLIGKILLLDT